MGTLNLCQKTPEMMMWKLHIIVHSEENVQNPTELDVFSLCLVPISNFAFISILLGAEILHKSLFDQTFSFEEKINFVMRSGRGTHMD